jgi:ABC-2 type transport system permease protein
MWAWVPLFLVSSVIADSFAGERERKTLEALLATRLSNRAILIGKVGAAVLYGWGFMLVSMLLALVSVNVAFGGGEILLYPPSVGMGSVVLGLLMSALAAAAGVLISLRASSVRQAQQTLSFAIMFLLFGLVYGVQALPEEWTAKVLPVLMSINATTAILVAAAVLLVIDAALLAAAAARFRRTRLILD